MANADLCDGKSRYAIGSGLRLSAFLAIALALAGCNASQTVDPTAGPINTSGRFANHYNPYNPVTHGQTSGFYCGR